MRRFRGLYSGYTGGARACRAATMITTIYLHPRSIPQIHRASSGDDLLHAHRYLDANQHFTAGVGGRPPQAPQLHRRGGGSAQPSHQGVLEDHARQRLLLPAGGKQRRHLAEVCLRPSPRPSRPGAPRARCAGVRPDGSIAGDAYGSRPRPHRDLDAGGRVFAPERRDKRSRHAFGYKGFDNDATNLRLLALITFGEGLHNNHHARPAAPKLSAFRGEFDPAWPVIRLLEALRLAKVTSKVEEGWDEHRRRIPPMAACTARASAADQPTSG